MGGLGRFQRWTTGDFPAWSPEHLARMDALGEERTPEARAELIQAHLPLALGAAATAARRYPQLGVDEDDLLSAALEGLTEAAHRYDGQGGVTPYFQLVVHSYVAKFVRGWARHVRPLVPDTELESMEAPNPLVSGYLHLAVDQALARLSPEQRELVDLLMHDGLTQDQVGQVMGLHPRKVRERWLRILEVVGAE